ncbi:hypothetical protein S83_011564 [Arachis hypogaea]
MDHEINGANNKNSVSSIEKLSLSSLDLSMGSGYMDEEVGTIVSSLYLGYFTRHLPHRSSFFAWRSSKHSYCVSAIAEVKQRWEANFGGHTGVIGGRSGVSRSNRGVSSNSTSRGVGSGNRDMGGGNKSRVIDGDRTNCNRSSGGKAVAMEDSHSILP